MGGIQVPIHSHRGSSHQGCSPLFPGPMRGVEYGPEAEAREGPEVPRAEILLPDHGDGEVPKGPGAHGEIDASVPPAIFHDEADEADAAEADTDPKILRARRCPRRRPGFHRDGEAEGQEDNSKRGSQAHDG